MLTAVQAAAVIAAIAFTVLAAAGVYALVKLARLISQASGVVADFRVRSDLLRRAGELRRGPRARAAREDRCHHREHGRGQLQHRGTDRGCVDADRRGPHAARRPTRPARRRSPSACAARSRCAGPARPGRPGTCPEPAAKAMRTDAHSGPAALPAGQASRAGSRTAADGIQSRDGRDTRGRDDSSDGRETAGGHRNDPHDPPRVLAHRWRCRRRRRIS